jgi:hypothetical protein
VSFDNPKVFGDGVLTVCIGTRGCTVYVGTEQIGFIENIEFEIESNGAPQAKIKLPKSHDKDIRLKLEEQIRILKTISWIQIR